LDVPGLEVEPNLPIDETMSSVTQDAPLGDIPAGLIPPSARARSEVRRIGDVVVELGFADRNTVEQAVAEARASGRPLGEVLVASGSVSSEQLSRALAERNNLPFVDLELFEVDKGAASLVSTSQARQYQAMPIRFLDERTILIATSNPANLVGLDDIAIITGYNGRLAISSPESLEATIDRVARLSDPLYEDDHAPAAEQSNVIELRESADQAPVVKLVHDLIADAVTRRASDIHFDPRDGDMRVRQRIDGIVSDSTTVPAGLVPALVSRVKIMAELNIAERRIPQDGRMRLSIDGRSVDLRVSTLPIMRGESVVLRILDKDQGFVDLDHLGLGPGERARLEHAIRQVQGAVLVTGPTGAGKTTTLYAALDAVNTPERTLIAIEDPVEYELDGVKQVQVTPKAGLTFASGLRSMIRSDPDVMMVGEIRDRETAQIAIESALTGHLVFSTLHTSGAPMAPARLIEMGIEPFLVASGVQCVVAQGLARRLCEACRSPVHITAAELEQSGLGSDRGGLDGFEPIGCLHCRGTGYLGRIGIYEVMTLNDEIRALILERESATEIDAAARRAGMRTLIDDGFEKVRQGITSVPEILRVFGG
jgi:type IV pilus assembly protein PilB